MSLDRQINLRGESSKYGNNQLRRGHVYNYDSDNTTKVINKAQLFQAQYIFQKILWVTTPFHGLIILHVTVMVAVLLNSHYQ